MTFELFLVQLLVESTWLNTKIFEMSESDYGAFVEARWQVICQLEGA